MKSLIIIISILFVSFFASAQSDMQMSVANFQNSTNFPTIDFKMDGYVVVGCQVIDTTGNEMRFLDIESGLTTIEDMTTLEFCEYQPLIEQFVDYMNNVSTYQDEDENIWLQWITTDVTNCNFLVCQILEDGFKVVATFPNSK